MAVYLLFVVGFVLLIKGADWLVAGSATIAKKNNVSNLVVGLTIVSMGTSMPELIVNVLASSKDASQIAIGNILGSNIANILLILGVAAFIYPIKIKESTVFSEIPYSIIALLLVAFVANSNLFGSHNNSINQIDGIILMAFFGLFVAYIIRLAKNGSADMIDDIPDEKITTGKSFLMVLLGIIGLFFGGQWVVNGAIAAAEHFGFSEAFIGLTVVAIGTSLPELVTSAVAAYRNNTDIAMANIIGSNIFNLLWVLGISAIIKPMSFDSSLNADILILLGASCLILFSLVTGKVKNQIGKPTGTLFILLYLTYVVFLIYRG
ncbi:MAG: calcium/sodium antiporter [Bacteroidia bacterium]|nr:calcium/sodium antiporter [Bacteroidia bacterium]